MPIYEYQCKACSHRFDTLQKISESPLKVCPECNEPELKKLVSAPSFRLKGSGWYETDFKKDNQRNVLKSDSEPATSSKTESKPTATSKESSGKETSKSPSKIDKS